MMRRAVPILLLLWLVGCSTAPTAPVVVPKPSAPQRENVAVAPEKGSNVVLYALSLIDSGYRYGGKNPEAGLDCSGMVSHIYAKAAGIRVMGSAADIARKGKPVDLAQARPGDLVFFNTRNRPHSHVGIYIGDGRFVHAPNSQGKVRTESLAQGWFAKRLEEARTYFD
ncbi:MAG: NlpC/P60 family protein [Sterolibacterium sp.]